MATRGIYTLNLGCDPVRAEFPFNGANPSYVWLHSLERKTGLEPAITIWEGCAPHLLFLPNLLVARVGFEPTISQTMSPGEILFLYLIHFH